MGKPTYNRLVTTGDELSSKIESGIALIKSIAVAAYGVKSGNVIIENRADPPTISHDGVTNIGAIEVSDAIEDLTVSTIKQASERTNHTAGDGTTLTTVLSCELYTWAKQYMAEHNLSPLEMAKYIESDLMPKIIEAVDKSTKHDITPDELRGACIVSAGDDALGELVYDVISQVGEYGGVNIVYTGNIGVSTEINQGLYIPKGMVSEALFNDRSGGRSAMSDSKAGVPIVILGNTVSKKDELADICDRIRTINYRQVVFIGDINGDALNYLEMVAGRNLLDVAVVKPPAQTFQVFLEDIALYTGGKVYTGATQDWTIESMGKASSVNITSRETTITGGAGENSEDVEKVVNELKDKAKTAEPRDRAGIESRIARLTAKVANIYVGGTAAVERGEVKLRVEDAICAAKSAITSGIVPGGGVCLRDIGNELDLSYLTNPYHLLCSGISTMKNLRKGYGYNIKTGEPCKMVDEMIVDPAIVIKEAVRNSHSVIAKLITVKVALTFEDRKWEF